MLEHENHIKEDGDPGKQEYFYLPISFKDRAALCALSMMSLIIFKE